MLNSNCKTTLIRKSKYNFLMRLLFAENNPASFYPNPKQIGIWTSMFRITWDMTKTHSLPYLQEVRNQRISKMNVSTLNYHLNLTWLTSQVENQVYKGKEKGKSWGPLTWPRSYASPENVSSDSAFFIELLWTLTELKYMSSQHPESARQVLFSLKKHWVHTL